MGVVNRVLDAGAGDAVPTAIGHIDTTGFFSNLSAGYAEAQAGPGSTRNRQNAFEAKYYDQIIQALTAQGQMGQDLIEVRPGGIGYTGPKNLPVNQFGIGHLPVSRPFRNPYTARPNISQPDNPVTRLYLNGDVAEKDAIWGAIQKVRQTKPDFLKDIPNEAALELLAERDREVKLGKAQAVTSRASTLGKVGAFIGNVAGSIAAGDPENVAGLGVGGAAASTVARTVIKRAATEGAVNAAAGLTALPGQAVDTERLGGEMTGADATRSIIEQGAIGALFGGVTAAAPHVAEGVKAVTDKVADVVATNAPPPVRDALAAASLRAGTVKDRQLLTEWRRLHNPYAAVGDTATPDEKAAGNVLHNDITAREASPLEPKDDAAHLDRLKVIADNLGVELKDSPEVPPPAPVQTPTVRDRSGPQPRRPASFVEGINAAEGHTRNPRSSADGYGNFIDSTWLSIAPRVTDTSGMNTAQILALRHDKGIAARATQLYAQDNGRYLRARGLEDSPGNLSLAHFLGPDGAARVLKASPDEPIERILSPEVISANHEVLEGKSASQVIAWAHKRIGATVDGPVARPDAVPEFDPLDEIDYADVRPHSIESLTPGEVQTDASLMQYKSGGDENGVTGKLAGVDAWNPLLASQLLVWEAKDGRKIVVDGHQRVGLAKKLFEDDPSIRLNAAVVREADGITARQARVLGALMNIEQGFGSLVDNARVLRDAPNGAKMLSGGEALTRDALGLSRLSYEGFGAVLNDVIDPRVAAQVGLHAGDRPESHMALIDLLKKERIASPAEATAVVRQATVDGFGTAHEQQLSLLGDMPVQSLYVPISRILSAAQKRLRNEKRTFKVLSENAGKIEAAGNVLDRAANESKVISNDEALGIIERTAHSAGPVRDALIAAARAELSGSGRAHAVGQFLDALSGIDLRAAARGVERDGGLGEGLVPSSERGNDPGADGELPESLRPSLFDEAVAARNEAERFSDPVGEAAKAQTDLLVHDLARDAPPKTVGNVPFLLRDKNGKPTGRVETQWEAEKIAAKKGWTWENTDDQNNAGPFSEPATRTPGVFYHGSRHKDLPHLLPGKITGGHSGLGRTNNAIYFTPDKKLADGYSIDGRVYQVELITKNPKVVPIHEIVSIRDAELEKLKAEGYDSLISDNGKEYAVFDQRQIKYIEEGMSTPTYRISEEGDAKPLHEIMAEADSDEKAAQAALDCLKNIGPAE